MTINKHNLDSTRAAGNGHHGYCRHCGLDLTTDLGYSSWENTKCLDREIVDIQDMPIDIIKYFNFFGFIWNKDQKLFIKPYSSVTFTVDSLIDHISKIKEYAS